MHEKVRLLRKTNETGALTVAQSPRAKEERINFITPPAPIIDIIPRSFASLQLAVNWSVVLNENPLGILLRGMAEKVATAPTLPAI